jgi:hypothetical protein
MNRTRSKHLFDCKRGLSGLFWDENDDDPANGLTRFVEPDTYGDEVYRGVCLRVTHEKPYSPEWSASVRHVRPATIPLRPSQQLRRLRK